MIHSVMSCLNKAEKPVQLMTTSAKGNHVTHVKCSKTSTQIDFVVVSFMCGHDSVLHGENKSLTCL